MTSPEDSDNIGRLLYFLILNTSAALVQANFSVMTSIKLL